MVKGDEKQKDNMEEVVNEVAHIHVDEHNVTMEDVATEVEKQT